MRPLASATLRLGDLAPNFTLADLDGRPFELADVIQGGAALVTFAPGVWSQSTRRQIDEFEALHGDFEALHVIPLIVVSQRARDARRSLQAHLAGADRNLTEPVLSFPILADEDRAVAREYGVFRAFSLDGVWITRPSIFLVETTGEIVFAHVGRNDGDVPETGSLLHLIRALARPRLIAPTRELEGPRQIQDWDLAGLPRVTRGEAVRELEEAPEPLQLLPAGQTSRTHQGNGKEPGEGPIPLGPPGEDAATPVERVGDPA